MKPSTAIDSTNITPAMLAMLEDCCSQEAAYAPGYIQPYGVILVLQESNLKILQASENVEEFFGISAATLIGKSLRYLFSQTQVQRIVDSINHNQLELGNPFELKTSRGRFQNSHSRKYQIFNGTIHHTTKALILELESKFPSDGKQNPRAYYHLQASILKLRNANSLSELASTLAQEVKALTEASRVMIYRFEADDHGVVIAEAKEPHLTRSYLGSHFPATDIPAFTRALFHRNWVRPIPDIRAKPVALVPEHHPLTGAPLDLSACVLRGVSPGHVEYLQNMGVTGSLTISLIDDKHLWGLIACHYDEPRLLDYETRKTCEFLGQFASIELVHQQDQSLNAYRAQVRVIQDELQWTFLKEPNFIEQCLIQYRQQLLDLVHAQGVAILLDGSLTCIGKTPSEDEIHALMAWLSDRTTQPQGERIFATDALSRLYPPASKFKDSASGILVISILLGQVQQASYHILWFRPEQIQTIDWAGNPQDAIEIDDQGNLSLCPRRSFDLWRETVREKSHPWQAVELEAATEMRNTLMLAVLEFSQMALEQSAERAAIANRAKSQFLAKMSHELRTPLNAILGFTQVMNRSPNTPAEFRGHLDIINRSGEHLLALINDVLEMSRIEAGQLSLAETYFNLHRLLQSIRDMFALKATQKGLSLCLEGDWKVPRYVYGDESKLRQILINLLNNAIKFTTEGHVTMRVKVQSLEQRLQSYIDLKTSTSIHPLLFSFEVEDTGCGIDSHYLECIFDAFMQTEQGRQAEGTGLGLSISRQFARLMGGNITVQSQVNHGSTFTCQVLLGQPTMISPVEPESTRLVSRLAPGQPTYRILVVEDMLENQQLLLSLLEPLGFEVRTADDGAAAIAQWQSWHPHLIFMDIQMPVMNGYEATRHIRAQESSRHYQDLPIQSPSDDAHPSVPGRTKIITLTADAFEDDRAASIEAGCDDYITKPFNETTLFDVIARHLNVQYAYVEIDESEQKPNHLSLTKRHFQAMSARWIEQVHEAAIDLDETELRHLIAQIPHHEQSLIEGLVYLVENFQFEAIATLTQP